MKFSNSDKLKTCNNDGHLHTERKIDDVTEVLKNILKVSDICQGRETVSTLMSSLKDIYKVREMKQYHHEIF